MHSNYFLLFCGLVSSLLLAACNRYSVSLNDKVVYTPPSIFKDYQLTDPQLQTCVEQTILDAQITRAEELTRLNCSNAGVKTLKGLARFFALRELNLADNRLTEIDEIGRLGRLEKLILNNNNITNSEPLLHLLHLQELNLEKNAMLDCSNLKQLQENYKDQTLKLNLPVHCTKMQ